MVKLWPLLALEPTVVNSLSLLKAEGEMEVTVGIKTKREVKLVYKLVFGELTLILKDCGDRPKVVNGNYIQPSKDEAYIDQDELELQCRKRL